MFVCILRELFRQHVCLIPIQIESFVTSSLAMLVVDLLADEALLAHLAVELALARLEEFIGLTGRDFGLFFIGFDMSLFVRL